MLYLSVLRLWLGDIQWVAFCVMAVLLLCLCSVLLLARHLNTQVMYYRGAYRSMEGTTVVITGATTGVGREAAVEFVKRGARVVIGTADEEQGRALAVECKDFSESGCIVPVHLDLSSLQSVRKFATHVLTIEKRLDLLCLCHSSSAPRRLLLTKDGLEHTMAANYFGHFLLTVLLYSLMKKTPNSRIIVSTSRIFGFLKNINAEDLVFREERYTPLKAASLSMVCRVLFVRHMAIFASKYDIRVNSFCPGFVCPTEYDDNSDMFTNRLRRWAGYLVGRTPLQGCQTLLFLALAGDDQVGSGATYTDCVIRQYEGASANEDLAESVFQQSEQLVGLSVAERKALF